MKRWTIGGITLLVIGFTGFLFRGGCQVEVSIQDPPPAELLGWDEEAAHSEETQQLVAAMPPFAIEGVWRDNSRANVRFWEIARSVGVDYEKWLSKQEVGDCVSWGACKACNWLETIQISLGHDEEFHELYPPYIYGTSRVQIGGGRLSGDGSVGAWAAKAVQQYGVLRLDAKGVPRYSGQIAREWGRRGPPSEFIEIAKRNPVRTVSPVRSAQEACDAICNGYPVTIAPAGLFGIAEQDGRMVSTRTSFSYAHQMHLCGFDGSSPSGKKWFYCLNSHGHDAHPKPLQGEPEGGAWLSWDDVDRICRNGDSFAFSCFVGFPAQDLDFNIFENQAKGGRFAINREVVMLSAAVGFFSVVLLVSVCSTRLRSRGLALLALCLVPTAIMGQEPDFSLFAPQAKPITCENGICFDVFGCDVPCPEDVDFAMFTPSCRCKDGLECTCPKGQCQCKEEAEKEDTRPLITIHCIKDCIPCEQWKNAAKGEDLKDFRFEIKQEDSVPGGAPLVEWQGVDAKWTIRGWHGVDFFKRAYEKSQTKSRNLISFRPVTRAPMMRPMMQPSFSGCSSCAGGVCRTCR